MTEEKDHSSVSSFHLMVSTQMRRVLLSHPNNPKGSKQEMCFLHCRRWDRARPPFVLISLVTQMEKRLPAMQETWVQPLDWEDPLEKAMATLCVATYLFLS